MAGRRESGDGRTRAVQSGGGAAATGTRVQGSRERNGPAVLVEPLHATNGDLAVTRRFPLLLVVTLAVLSACMPAMRISPHGRRTTVVSSSAPTTTGELIAVTQDSIWLMRDSTLLVFASQQVRRVQVQRHQYDAKRTMVWMAIAGGATALALTTACG